MAINPLYLTEKDLQMMKEIGRGTDGIVYKSPHIQNRNILFKIYHHPPALAENPSYKKVYDEAGVNIADNRALYRQNNYSRYHTTYYNSDGVKINGVEAVYKAIERQQYITRTKLQKRPIYIGKNFRGTVLHYHKRAIAIHNLIFFPISVQIKVLKELLLAVKELLENYIYHIDLSLKPEKNYKEANVLLTLNPFPRPAIIDIDGKSAIYTESKVIQYQQQSLLSLKALITEILFGIDIEKIDDLDYGHLENNLESLGIKISYIESILNPDIILDTSELNEFLEDMQLIKNR